jgi:hypothetical protein
LNATLGNPVDGDSVGGKLLNLRRLPAEGRSPPAKLWVEVADQLARTKEPMPKDKEMPDKP